MIPQWEREAAERIAAVRPQPTEAELQKATQVIKPLLEKHRTLQPWDQIRLHFLMLIFFASTLFFYVALPSLIAALLFRGGLLLAILGIGVVTRTGQRASRGRMFWRNIVAWSPMFTLPILVAFATPLWGVSISVALVGAVYLALVIWSLLLPDRGLPDRLARTYLVPR